MGGIGEVSHFKEVANFTCLNYYFLVLLKANSTCLTVYFSCLITLFEGTDDCQASLWFKDIPVSALENDFWSYAELSSCMCSASLSSHVNFFFHLWLGLGIVHAFFFPRGNSFKWQHWSEGMFLLLSWGCTYKENWAICAGNSGSWTLSVLHGCGLNSWDPFVNVMRGVLRHSSDPISVSLYKPSQELLYLKVRRALTRAEANSKLDPKPSYSYFVLLDL